MNELAKKLLTILADGQYHSGEILGSKLKVTRSAVWKSMKHLEDMGIDIYSIPGRGYSIPGGIDLLNEKRICSLLSQSTQKVLKKLYVFDVIDSTNQFLLQHRNKGSDVGIVCTAEAQTQGRGRRGKQWVSPFGRNVYVSLLWDFSQGASALSGLSLAVALSVAKVLKHFNLEQIAIKWPNDILCQQKKIAGILIDIAGDIQGPSSVVVGVGINVSHSLTKSIDIDQPWIDFANVLPIIPSRNAILATLLNELFTMLPHYERYGFQAYHQQWASYDILYDKPIVIKAHREETKGIAQGVDKDGHLMVEQHGKVQTFNSGEVSVRLV